MNEREIVKKKLSKYFCYFLVQKTYIYKILMKSDIYNEIHRLQPFGNSSFTKTIRGTPSQNTLRQDPSSRSSAKLLRILQLFIPPASTWAWLIQRVWALRPINLLSFIKLLQMNYKMTKEQPQTDDLRISHLSLHLPRAQFLFKFK